MNARKPRALKKYESDKPIRKSRDYNPLESEMSVSVSLVNITPPLTLKGKSLELWNQLVPGLINIGLIAAQDKMNLDSVFFLYQELLLVQDDLIKAREKGDDNLIDRINNQLNRTSKSLDSAIARLGFSPKDRTYFKSKKESNGNAIDDILGVNE